MKTFSRFVLVGLLNTAFGYSIFSLLIFLGLHYTVAILIATVLGVLFNFKTIGKLVFNNPHNHLFFKFIGVYTITYCINIILVKLLLINHINIYLAGAIAIFLAALVSYTLNKNWVFK